VSRYSIPLRTAAVSIVYGWIGLLAFAVVANTRRPGLAPATGLHGRDRPAAVAAAPRATLPAASDEHLVSAR
jgi:hypothetical protein